MNNVPTAANGQAQTDSARTLQRADIAEMIESILHAFEQHYVYPDTARALSEHIQGKCNDGEYDDIPALDQFAAQLRDDLRSFTNDRHIHICVISPDDPQATGDTITDAEIARRARSNFNVRKAEWLVGNVGYLRLDGFEDAEYAGDAVAAAMHFISRCDAVILDLRYNHGGHETMVRFLASYFFKRPTIINAHYFPETDSLEQSWTTAYVPGRKMVGAGLYILTSRQTGSGAEAFSYGMKHAGRAVLVGETTAGLAHWTESWHFLNLRLRADIPIARPVNPVTKTSWEGTGVTPHIETPSDNSLFVAHREALKRMLERTSDDDMRQELTWDLVSLEAHANPITLTPERMLSYAGEYAHGRYAILTRDDSLFWRYSDGNEYLLIPLDDDLFGFEDTDDHRLKFVRGDAGAVIGFRLVVKGKEPGSIREKTADAR